MIEHVSSPAEIPSGDSAISEQSDSTRSAMTSVLKNFPELLERGTESMRSGAARSARILDHISATGGAVLGGMKNLLTGWRAGYEESQTSSSSS